MDTIDVSTKVIITAHIHSVDTVQTGRLHTIEVDEPNSSGSLTENTCYAYDLNGNLTQVVSASSQTRSYSYDDLSRVLSASVPETNVGGTQYSTTYSYTSSGSPCSGDPMSACSRTDPRGITTTYTYDALNRLTRVSYSDSTPTVTYCYDGSNSTCISGGYSSTNGKGRRTAMSDGSGSTGWSYDADGRIVTEKRTIGTATKTISYSYNEDGSIASITYPSGRVITYTTGNAERSLSAVDSANNINYALLASYSPAGGVSQVIYGRVTNGFNGTTEARQYNNRLETTSITASSSNGTALSLSPCYTAFTLSSSSCSGTAAGNNGSVTGIVNGVDSNTTLGFSYDTLNRILSALTKSSSGNDCWGQGFGPDAVANLTSITVSQCSAGSLSASTDGYNHLTNTGYSYDYAGDMTGDGSYTYTYDAEERITSANGVSYTYDGNGLRVKKSTGTLYWRSITGDVLAETDSGGSTQNEYVFFAGRRIAQRTSGGTVYFYYADTLGTIHTITNGTGTACYDATFTPYGEEMLNPNISQTCSSNYKFTGYEYDSETGLYYAKARYYNPRPGRFMTTDPLQGDVTDPQSLNRYAYVINEPTTLIDPLGMDNCVQGKGAGVYVSCQNGGNDGQDDGVLVGMPGGGGVLLDGIWTPGSLFAAGEGEAYAICPGTCAGFGKDPYTGQTVWLDYTVGAAGNTEWLSGYDWTQGVYDWKGAFVSGAEYQADLWAATQGYRDYMQARIAAILGIDPSQLQSVGLRGGNADFSMSESEWDYLSANTPGCEAGGFGIRCSGSNLHFGTTFSSDGTTTYWVHMDSGDLYSGLWGAFVHFAVDYIGGNTIFQTGVPH